MRKFLAALAIYAVGLFAIGSVLLPASALASHYVWVYCKGPDGQFPYKHYHKQSGVHLDIKCRPSDNIGIWYWRTAPVAALMTCSVETSKGNLEKANRVMAARTAVKRGIKAGKFNPLEVMQEPTELVKGMPVRELLLAVHGLGPTAVDPALEASWVSYAKKVGDLKDWQIWELDEKLSEHRPWCYALSKPIRR